MPSAHDSLTLGDRVAFTSLSIDAVGTIIEILAEDYVRVRWENAAVSTTHRRHALRAVGYTRFTARRLLA